MSCVRDRENGRQQAAERTWTRAWPGTIDYKFVIGGGAMASSSHDFVCNEPDTYDGVPAKFRAARKFALDRGYNHIFHACIDTWINIPRLLTSGFENHDYTGYRCDEGHGSGGMGYWTSAKAAQVLMDTPYNGDYEDRWVGAALASAGISLYEDRRYSSPANPNRPHDEITLHLSRGTDNYDPQWMYDQHEKWLESYL
jgi:hypothetical protein